MNNVLDLARDWMHRLIGHNGQVERMERATASITADSRKIAHRLDEISRNRDPLAELVRNVKSARFRTH